MRVSPDRTSRKRKKLSALERHGGCRVCREIPGGGRGVEWGKKIGVRAERQAPVVQDVVTKGRGDRARPLAGADEGARLEVLSANEDLVHPRELCVQQRRARVDAHLRKARDALVEDVEVVLVDGRARAQRPATDLGPELQRHSGRVHHADVALENVGVPKVEKCVVEVLANTATRGDGQRTDERTLALECEEDVWLGRGEVEVANPVELTLRFDGVEGRLVEVRGGVKRAEGAVVSGDILEELKAQLRADACRAVRAT